MSTKETRDKLGSSMLPVKKLNLSVQNIHGVGATENKYLNT